MRYERIIFDVEKSWISIEKSWISIEKSWISIEKRWISIERWYEWWINENTISGWRLYTAGVANIWRAYLCHRSGDSPTHIRKTPRRWFSIEKRRWKTLMFPSRNDSFSLENCLISNPIGDSTGHNGITRGRPWYIFTGVRGGGK